MFIHIQTKLIKSLDYILYGIGIILLRLPPFYILPIHHSLFTTHSIARYIFMLLVATCFIRLMIFKKNYQISVTYTILLLLYFLTQSLSIINVVNITEFLLIYKNILFGLAIFLTGLIIIDSPHKLSFVVKSIIYPSVAILIFQSIIYFQIPILSFLEKIMYENYWEGVLLNMNRNKFFIDIYDAALIPLFLSLVFIEKKYFKKIFYYLICGFIAFFSFISNFRTHFLMLIFSLATSFIFLLKRKVYIIGAVCIFFLFSLLANALSIRFIGSNTLDRIVDPVSEDYATIESRFVWWQLSTDMALTYPLFGVGLGNYFDHLPASFKIPYFSLSNEDHQLRLLTLNHPHNIFFGTLAETGFLGFISLLSLILYFVITDFKNINTANRQKTSFILAFWCLFLFALFNPPTTIPYLSLFWLLRLLILKSEMLFIKK